MTEDKAKKDLTDLLIGSMQSERFNLNSIKLVKNMVLVLTAI
ncbi:hypothetical protein [Latilactobacillus curvatus]|nr:hypothetical protein [Latilactobacillus curvatus]